MMSENEVWAQAGAAGILGILARRENEAYLLKALELARHTEGDVRSHLSILRNLNAIDRALQNIPDHLHVAVGSYLFYHLSELELVIKFGGQTPLGGAGASKSASMPIDTTEAPSASQRAIPVHKPGALQSHLYETLTWLRALVQYGEDGRVTPKLLAEARAWLDQPIPEEPPNNLQAMVNGLHKRAAYEEEKGATISAPEWRDGWRSAWAIVESFTSTLTSEPPTE